MCLEGSLREVRKLLSVCAGAFDVLLEPHPSIPFIRQKRFSSHITSMVHVPQILHMHHVCDVRKKKKRASSGSGLVLTGPPGALGTLGALGPLGATCETALNFGVSWPP